MWLGARQGAAWAAVSVAHGHSSWLQHGDGFWENKVGAAPLGHPMHWDSCKQHLPSQRSPGVGGLCHRGSLCSQEACPLLKGAPEHTSTFHTSVRIGN